VKRLLVLLLSGLSPVGGGYSVILLGQATNMDPGILSLVGNGVTIVVLAWYVFYDVKTRTPNMLAAFHAEQKATRAEYREIIDGMRVMFLSEQAGLRAQYDRQLEELRQILFDTMKSMRVAVHDVKDTAQTLMSKDELEGER
jgi:hypothetical protein